MNLPKSTDVKNKKVLVRVDFNVSDLKKDHYRFQCATKTIAFLLKNKSKQIILISHLGRPEGKEEKYSLKKLIPILEKTFKQKIKFYDKLENLPEDKIVLLENIRFWKEEDKDDKAFAKKLAKLGDVYINEAFSVSHRKTSSLCAITKFLPSFYGFNFISEIKALDSLNKNIKHPFTMIIGGAKTEDKIPLLEKFLKPADFVLVGGVPANTLWNMYGAETGKSLVDKNVKIKNLESDEIVLPIDFQIKDKNNKLAYRTIDDIQLNDNILDLGEYSLELFKIYIEHSKTIFWNGPLGFTEEKPFDKSTKELVKILAKSKAKIIIGGGETLEFVKPLMNKKNIFISSGGGALLYYLINGTFPCLKK